MPSIGNYPARVKRQKRRALRTARTMTARYGDLDGTARHIDGGRVQFTAHGTSDLGGTVIVAADDPSLALLTPSRQAYGAHRQRTPEQKAQHIAESIALRQDEGRAWTWATYGLENNPDQQALVRTALAQLGWSPEEEERLQAWYYEQEYARLEDEARHAEAR